MMLVRKPKLILFSFGNIRFLCDSHSFRNQLNNSDLRKEKFFQFNHRKGLFGHPILSNYNGFFIFRQNAIDKVKSLIDEAISRKRNRKIVKVFDELSNNLCKVADLAEFIRISHPDPNYTYAAEQASITINNEVEKLNTNRLLYDILKKVDEEGDVVETTETDRYVNKLFLFDFEQCGIHLEENTRDEVVRLNEQILHVGTCFMHGTTKPKLVNQSEIPEHLWQYFPLESNHNVVISGTHNESSSEELRAVTFKQFFKYDDHQDRLLNQLLKSRLKLARICEFDSFAHRAINGSIAGTPEFVWNLINTVNDLCRDRSQNDFEIMRSLKQKDSANDMVELMQWDINYFLQYYRDLKFGSDIRQASPYFSLGSCLDGLDLIFKSIFNITLKISSTDDEDIWHPSILKLSVIDLDTNTNLGYIYCDLFVRPNKPSHECHFTIQGGCQLPTGIKS
ncbi:uncharacterized protein NH340_JMT05009 [Sarcoptes scabiei]|nr:uncharacterized protein NH340_JMT05009 [Sarcoptes scabiei]